MDPLASHRAAPTLNVPGRAVHTVDPAGFQAVAKRKPRKGELYADDHGPSAWIFIATEHGREPAIIVRPTLEGSYP